MQNWYVSQLKWRGTWVPHVQAALDVDSSLHVFIYRADLSISALGSRQNCG